MESDPSIKFNNSQNSLKPANKVQLKKFMLSIVAHLSTGQSIPKPIEVNNDTNMDDIKIAASKEFYPEDKLPPTNQIFPLFFVFWNQIYFLDRKFTIGQLKKCLQLDQNNSNQTTINLEVFQSAIHKMKSRCSIKYLWIWVDANFKQNRQCFDKITQKYHTKDQTYIVQLESNQDFNQWRIENRIIIKLFYEMNRLFVVSNLNRCPNFNQEGLQTLRMVRNTLERQPFVFYIGNKAKCQEALKQNCSQAECEQVYVFNHPKDMAKHFNQNFLKRLGK